MSIQQERSCESLCLAGVCAFLAHVRTLKGMLLHDVLFDVVRAGEQALAARPCARMLVLAGLVHWIVTEGDARHVRDLRWMINLRLERHQLTTLLVSEKQADDPEDESAATASTGLYVVELIL